MISICERYAEKYQIKFNGKKCNLIAFGKCTENINPKLFVCGERVNCT